MSRLFAATILVLALNVPLLSHAQYVPVRPAERITEFRTVNAQVPHRQGVHQRDDQQRAQRAPYLQFAQSHISASEAKAIALRTVRNSEVVDISKNGDVYRVRVIRKDGRVVDVFIDAETGRVRR